MEARGLRCDLHVHTRYSGPVDLPLLHYLSNESHSHPEEVYELSRSRGMDLVTVTDHDTIDGVVRLLGRPDVFAGEEVTVHLEGGRCLHICVWDLDEAQHAAIAARQRDAEALFAYLAEQRLPFGLNHPFSPLTGRREEGDLRRALPHARLVEARNGMMPVDSNRHAERVAHEMKASCVGGSDAHTLASVARAWTEVPGARTREEFLEGLRQGCTLARGANGSYARLTADVTHVFWGAVGEGLERAGEGLLPALRAATLVAMLPLFALVPLVTLRAHLKERRFANALARRLGLVAPARPVRLLADGGEA